MKIIAVILKSLIEQGRQKWIILLTLLMAPFFVAVYYLMWETTSFELNIELVNLDEGYNNHNYGRSIEEFVLYYENDTLPVNINLCQDRSDALEQIENNKASAILILPPDFSRKLETLKDGEKVRVPFEISGDLTDFNFMLSASWTYELMAGYISEVTGAETFIEFRETPIGVSGSADDFDLYVPGLLILSIVMLMFTASIAFVRESEQKTMIRLKLSKIFSWELIMGISVVQVLIGIVAILLTLAVAALLGFQFNGSWGLFFLVACLTSVSIIAFSLIVAAFTKNVNQVLVAGNFPLFLFMFFTGAMMPVHGPTLFSFASYDFTVPGLMSPYHAVRALKKISIFQSSIIDIWPEMACLLGLTIIYFMVGSWLFRRRHLNLL